MNTINNFDSLNIPKELRIEVLKLKDSNTLSAVSIILFNYLLVALSIYLCYKVSFWFYLISIVVIGSVQRVMANLLHEAAHGLLSPNKKLNDILGTYFTSYLILHLLIPYKKTHLHGHHPHCGDEEKDPDYNFQLSMGLYDDNERYSIFFLKNIILTLIGYRTIEYIRFIYNDRVFYDTKNLSRKNKNEFKKERLRFFALWVVILTTIGFSGLFLDFLIFWMIPLFTTYITIGWIAELAEHYPLPESENAELLLTRNRHGNGIENFIFGRHGDRYHLVHHLCPSIPCYRLKQAHEILRKSEAYCQWDDIWGGIFFRRLSNTETLLSYTKKYREWKKNPKEKSFGRYMLYTSKP
ncbi:fatty acid desaturase family protein [Aquimarina intermedia]|uniref:Fatty acid desaturase n=1 Tax=Aquimarina intermedia TaxID=350814 RepID=A0A5S5C7A0_9FLAO|nr:fatty acid desaturase family protein [Aquimarina intermedia]TYP74352.1 fatty acid desaturase [Aquimarina intermedia]